MKDYELTVLFHPDLEMNLDPALDKVKKIITSHKGIITKEDNDSKKHLAYKIKGQDFAVFYYFDVQLPADAPNAISTTLNITDEVLRHLLVRAGHRQDKNTEPEIDASADESTTNSAEKGE